MSFFILLGDRPREGYFCRDEEFNRNDGGSGVGRRAPAWAIVGGAPPSTEGIGHSVVTIVGSRGNSCTGTLIAPDLVLSVAHCVGPGATYKIVEYGTDRQPQLKDVKSVAAHPGFDMQTMLAHRATADVTLLQLETPKTDPSPIGVP